MRPSIQAPQVKVAGSILSDYDPTRLVATTLRMESKLVEQRPAAGGSGNQPGKVVATLPGGEMALIRRGGENIACIPVAKDRSVVCPEDIHIGYTTDRNSIGEIVSVYRKDCYDRNAPPGQWHGQYLGLFRQFDAAAMTYLYNPQRRGPIVKELIAELQNRPELFLMFGETMKKLGIGVGERVVVEGVYYVNPIEQANGADSSSTVKEPRLLQMPRLSGFEDIFLPRL